MDFIYEYSIPEKTKKSVTKSQKNKKLESKIICFCNVGQKSEYSNKKRFFMAVNRISNATIEEISKDRNNTLATVAFRDRRNNRGEEQRIRMVVGPGTVVVKMDGNRGMASDLSVGMVVNAILSTQATRSVPPQSEAFFVEIVRGGMENSTTVGRIVDIDRMGRNFTIISDGDFTSIIRFNVPQGMTITNRMGRNMEFTGLLPGMRVEVRHANFMTASIPPQTTALEIKVL